MLTPQNAIGIAIVLGLVLSHITGLMSNLGLLTLVQWVLVCTC